MKYKVKTNEKEFELSVEHLKDNNNENDIVDEFGDDESLMVYQREYDHCFERSNKLDNKVYILLTICAFLFVMLSENIKVLSYLRLPKSTGIWISQIVYILILFANLGFFLRLIITLVDLLKGIKLSRIDAYEIISKDMIRKEKKQVISYICFLYEKCKDYNNKQIEMQYQKYSRCIFLIVINIVLLLVSAIYSKFL